MTENDFFWVEQQIACMLSEDEMLLNGMNSEQVSTDEQQKNMR